MSAPAVDFEPAPTFNPIRDALPKNAPPPRALASSAARAFALASSRIFAASRSRFQASSLSRFARCFSSSTGVGAGGGPGGGVARLSDLEGVCGEGAGEEGEEAGGVHGARYLGERWQARCKERLYKSTSTAVRTGTGRVKRKEGDETCRKGRAIRREARAIHAASI